LQELGYLQNFHFLGRKQASDVPNYLRWFDVALIPFLVTPSTNTMYPYKLHEYLGMGKPVVSTDLFELQAFDGIVCLAKSHDEFMQMVEGELANDSKERVQQRIDLAQQNNWDKRVEEMSAYIEESLREKYA
jgi:glycosyltransferase involved in cell wall biosynthesis